MTFKFKFESHVLKHPAQWMAVFPLEFNIEIDLVNPAGVEAKLDYVFIQSELGDLYKLEGLPKQDRAEVKEIIESYRQQYSDYLVDMKAGASEVAQEIITDEVG